MLRHPEFPAPASQSRPVLAIGLPLVLMMASLFTVSVSQPSSPQFYIATACAAAALIGGWFFFGDRRVLGSRVLIDASFGALIGAALGGIFVVGSLVIVQIPFLAAPVSGLLENAAGAALVPTLITTWANGAAEELFFRNTVVRHLTGLGRWAIPAAIALYVVGTLPMQVPVLALAAIAVGAVAHFEVRRTGALTSAILMHLSWSTVMILVLPHVV